MDTATASPSHSIRPRGVAGMRWVSGPRRVEASYPSRQAERGMPPDSEQAASPSPARVWTNAGNAAWPLARGNVDLETAVHNANRALDPAVTVKSSRCTEAITDLRDRIQPFTPWPVTSMNGPWPPAAKPNLPCELHSQGRCYPCRAGAGRQDATWNLVSACEL